MSLNFPESRRQMNMANRETHVIRVTNANKTLNIVVKNGDESMTVKPMMFFEIATDNPKRFWIDANVLAIQNVTVRVWELD
ncbi:hypothetical protein NVP1020O_01 [Vibrio phage 1.020.O._10N.222.48.A2]|uniref:Uncharacterized protein n=1 Tax=Vibrio phage 1.020.O._10N.222.48.A2 TaxID=1881450 RepID=A0A2I7QKY2_9VIRU|nr:hypothetical protein KMD66_gp01 [Vibrio phage 1.020.O._10N.222.48.A2]AUR82043.1 hypothetical protein NVP1020O_01 [Vibrio phage 1.020.O._10N.222.48.A2]